MSLFQLITIYNINFQIIINKLSSLSKNLLANLQLAAYLYKIKVIYPDFAVNQRFFTRLKIPEFSTIIAKLKDEEKHDREVESIAFPI